MFFRNLNRTQCIGGGFLILVAIVAIITMKSSRDDTSTQEVRERKSMDNHPRSRSAHRSGNAQKRREEEKKERLIKLVQLHVKTAEGRVHSHRVQLMEVEYFRSSFIERWESSGATIFLFLIKPPDKEQLKTEKHVQVFASDLHIDAQKIFKERLESVFRLHGSKETYKAVWIEVLHQEKNKNHFRPVAISVREYHTYENFTENCPDIRSLSFNSYVNLQFGKGWRYSHLLDIKKMKPMPRFKFGKQLDMQDW